MSRERIQLFSRLFGLLLICSTLLAGCKEDADDFFSGRPSGMAMAHNRVLDGTMATMLDLLRIPGRFPEADAGQISDWQESALAWWQAPNGHDRMVAALGQLTAGELSDVNSWTTMRGGIENPDKLATLDAIATEIAIIRRKNPGKAP